MEELDDEAGLLLDERLEWLLLGKRVVALLNGLLDTLVEWLLLEGEAECTLEGVLELEWELTGDSTLNETLVAELKGEILLDEDEIGCAEFEEIVWLEEVTYLKLRSQHFFPWMVFIYGVVQAVIFFQG